MPASAQPAGAPVEAPPPASPAAAALAEIVVPAERFDDLQVAVARQGIVAAFAQEIGADWQARYPGLLEAIWKDVEPELRRQSAKSRPVLMQRLAALYSARLTESEIRVLDRFYRSPTGQKMIRVMYEEADYTPILDDMLADENARVSTQALRRTHESGKARMLAQLTAEDEAALVRLGRSLPLAKMTSVGAEVQRTTASWINEPDPEGEERIAKVMEAAAARYMEEHPQQR